MLRMWHTGPTALEAGIDEAGRGALAGPVVAAAVVWNPELSPLDVLDGHLIRDSKKLSRAQRERARVAVTEHALAWCVCEVGAAEIDGTNILRATMAAMRGAVRGLGLELDLLLVDGDRFARPVSEPMPPHVCVVRGDDTYLSIAAASVLAKTHRDALMRAQHAAHPEYGWERNVGYGTAAHMAALARGGPCRLHRMSFAPCTSAGGLHSKVIAATSTHPDRK